MGDEERMLAEALLEAQQRTTLYPNAKAVADTLAPLVLDALREARGFGSLHRTVMEFCATLRGAPSTTEL